ncbi:MAG: N-acetyltransferase, partial [Halioglobus sp.]|nr:N-acetyltransferase [Halioglobus sp.]
FSDDPVMNWSCNNPDSLVPFFELTLEPFLPHGLVYLDAQQRGAACWLGPGETLKWSYRPSNVSRIFRQVGLKGLYRMILSGMATEKHHPKAPHYYLFAIGAGSAYRGQGVGSALISHMLRRCDEEGVPAYLENSKEQNLRFYEGHGFRVQKEIRFADTAPPVWLMWREPGGRA